MYFKWIIIFLCIFYFPYIYGKNEKKYFQYSIAFYEIKLSNGLHVYVVEDHRQPIVLIQTSYHVGIEEVNTLQSAWPHLLEHSLSMPLEKYVQSIGGEYYAYVTSNETNYTNVIPAQFIYPILLKEKYRMQGKMNITNLEVKQSKQLVQQELALSLKRFSLERFIGESLYLSHQLLLPYSSIGNEISLKHVNKKQLKEFYHYWYTPNNANIMIIGDVSYSDINKFIHKQFESLPSHPIKHVFHSNIQNSKKRNFNIIRKKYANEFAKNHGGVLYFIKIYNNLPNISSSIFLNRILFDQRTGYVTQCLLKTHTILALFVSLNIQDSQVLNDSLILIPWQGVTHTQLYNRFEKCLKSLDKKKFAQAVLITRNQLFNVFLNNQDSIFEYSNLINEFSGFNSSIAQASKSFLAIQKLTTKNLFKEFKNVFLTTPSINTWISSKPLIFNGVTSYIQISGS